MAIITPLLVLFLTGCLDFGRFANDLIGVTNAAGAGAVVAVMSHYPGLDSTQGNGLINWQRKVCTAVANELGMSDDFSPAGLNDPNGYMNSQGLYVQAVCNIQAGDQWQAQITARYPFKWWSIPSTAQPQQTVVYCAIR
jgi:Flp pilus assembly protein TadG